jgi:hypothetical protein
MMLRSVSSEKIRSSGKDDYLFHNLIILFIKRQLTVGFSRLADAA